MSPLSNLHLHPRISPHLLQKSQHDFPTDRKPLTLTLTDSNPAPKMTNQRATNSASEGQRKLIAKFHAPALLSSLFYAIFRLGL